MVGADIVSTHHTWFAGVAERFQRSEQPVSAASSQISAVLKSEPARAALFDKPDGFEVEARAFAFDPLAFGVGAVDVLARRRSDDDVGKESDVGNKSGCRESADVFVEPDMGIILRVEDAAPFDDFAGGHGDETGAMQAERPATSSRAEQVKRAHHGRKSTGTRRVSKNTKYSILLAPLEGRQFREDFCGFAGHSGFR